MNQGANDELEVDELIGKVFDERYRIEDRLGEGGIGRVYRARHLTLGKFVALKVLLTKYESIPVLQKRFQREAEALAALSHPNIVTVTDFGVADENPYLVMELLEGTDLAHVVHNTPEGLDPKRVIDIMRQTLRALSYAHAQGLVHRDLKPHNIFVRKMGDGSDHVEVLDFGLARFMGDAKRHSMKLTHVGALIGTPAYMAPEQASGEEADARSDIYAVGCVMFEALTGRRVFERPNQGEVLRAHLMHIPPTVSQGDPGLSTTPELDALLARALAKSPASRFQTANEMIAALEELPPNAALRVAPRPPLSQPMSMVLPTQGGPTRPGTPQALADAPANDSEVELPTTRLPLFIGLGCLAVLVLIGAAVAGWFLDVGALLDAAQGTEEVAEPDDPDEPPAPAAPRVAPADLLSDADPELAALNQQTLEPIEPGSDIDRALVARIQAWANAVPGRRVDPRYHLVLAHAYARHSSPDNPVFTGLAFAQYQAAFAANHAARGDQRMLPDLLRFFQYEETQLTDEISGLIELAYGDEAVEEVEAAMPGASDDARRRLESLAGRLRAGAAAERETE